MLPSDKSAEGRPTFSRRTSLSSSMGTSRTPLSAGCGVPPGRGEEAGLAAEDEPPSFDLDCAPDPSATCEGRLLPDEGLGGWTPVFGLSGSAVILTSLSASLMSLPLGTEKVTSLPS